MSAVTVVGNVNNVELKFTPNGKAVLEFSVAENHSKKDQQGNWQEDGTTWRDVSIWEKKAEALGPVLKNGDRVVVVGDERIREWTSKDGSNTGKTLEMVAKWVGIVPKFDQPQQPQGGFGGQPQAQQNAGNWGALGGQQQQANGGWGAPDQSANPPF